MFLRIEFSVDPGGTDVSSLQFSLTVQQAKHIGAKLSSYLPQRPTVRFGVGTQQPRGSAVPMPIGVPLPGSTNRGSEAKYPSL